MIYISKLFSPISTGTSAGDIDVGATVKINEYGSPVNYLVVHQGLPGEASMEQQRRKHTCRIHHHVCYG